MESESGTAPILAGLENDTPLEIYEVPALVKGSWGSANHQNLVSKVKDGTIVEKNKLDYIKAGASAPDFPIGDIDFSLSSYNSPGEYYDVLHARRNTNYVGAVKCLLNAAYEIAAKGNTATTQEEVKAYCDYIYQDGEESTTEKTMDRKALKKVIKAACFYRLTLKPKEEVPVKVSGGVTAERASLQLLGIAIHVASDTYAHRTVIPGTEFYPGSPLELCKGFFPNYEELKDRILSGGVVTTSGLREYTKEDVISAMHKTFADNINYLPKRYDMGSYFAVRELFFLYVLPPRREELPYVFCPLVMNKQGETSEIYELRLQGLMKNLHDMGYSMENYTIVSVTEWHNLSK